QHLLDDKKHLSQQVQSLNLGRQDSFLSCRQTLSIDPINKHTFLFSCLDHNSSPTSQNQRQSQKLKFFYLLNKIYSYHAYNQLINQSPYVILTSPAYNFFAYTIQLIDHIYSF